MKRVKIMLTAIAALGIVGGALAFKAKRGNFVYCTTTSATGTFCPLTAVDAIINVGSNIRYVTVAPGTDCTTTTECTKTGGSVGA